MQKGTFGSYKSTNDRLHNKLVQTDQYQKFLKRIESIVDRRRKIDRSPEFYMTFLNRSCQKSNRQKSVDREFVVQLENRNLLERIQREKNRKAAQGSSVHEVHWEGRRVREQEKINQENGKMAERIMKQNSCLLNKGIISVDVPRGEVEKSRVTKFREEELKFFDSRIKNRRLPKLIRPPEVAGETIEPNSVSFYNSVALR